MLPSEVDGTMASLSLPGGRQLAGGGRLRTSAISVLCILFVLALNVKEMVVLDGGAKLPWPAGLRQSLTPANRPAYFLRPRQRFRSLPLRREGVRRDLVKSGDFVYYPNPENWDTAPVVIPSHKLVFFTVPKVGCTVWKQLFRRMMGHPDWASQDGARGLPHDPATNGLLYLYNFSRAEASAMMTDPSWTRALMVREPKQRFLSAFLDKAVSNDHRHIYDRCCPEGGSPLRAACRAAEYSAAGFLRLAAVCHDAHWAPQDDRIDAKYWPYIDRVLHVESAAADAAALLQTIGRWDKARQAWVSAWDEYGRSGWGRDGTASIFASQSVEAAGEHATWSQYKHWKWLTPQIEMKLERFYQADYENPLFNFTQGMCLTCI